jgi:hypothetical protein
MTVASYVVDVPSTVSIFAEMRRWTVGENDRKHILGVAAL